MQDSKPATTPSVPTEVTTSSRCGGRGGLAVGRLATKGGGRGGGGGADERGNHIGGSAAGAAGCHQLRWHWCRLDDGGTGGSTEQLSMLLSPTQHQRQRFAQFIVSRQKRGCQTEELHAKGHRDTVGGSGRGRRMLFMARPGWQPRRFGLHFAAFRFRPVASGFVVSSVAPFQAINPNGRPALPS